MTLHEATVKALPGMLTEFATFSGSNGRYACTYIPNVVYAHYDRDYTLQILQPQGKPEQVFPLVAFVQGSAWMKQNVYSNLPSLCHLAECGFVVAIVEYRDLSTAGHPAQVEDAKAAIRFMRANAAKYHVDAQHAAVFGDSSGGHVALMTGVTPGEYNNGLYADQSDAVDAVVDFYGITDILALNQQEDDFFDHTSPQSPEARLLGGIPQAVTEKAMEASPFYRLSPDPKLPHILIVHGDDNHCVHILQSVKFVEKMQECGQPVTFVKVLGADHGPGIWCAQRMQFIADFLHAAMR